MNDKPALTEATASRPSRRRAMAPTALAAAALALAALGAAPLSAANADFAGIWQLDPERSDSLAPGRRGQQQQQPPVDVELDVSLDGEDVVMSYTLRREDAPAPAQVTQKLVTDGKPHETTGLRGGKRTTRVRWRKDKLAVSYTTRGPFGEFDVTETWQLSKDGSELQVTMHTRIPDRRPDIRKFIYTRATTVQ
ncbi:MAG: hypothetical protein F4210_10030 [Holophagales bacterium]|nr:hypothetical protein [Holophagales bacterium]MYF95829.1 hypothetical protein [Holophagales bacterium]